MDVRDCPRKILYITYDGLTDALGQSQILAYLKRLANYNHRIVIVSYEKKDSFKKYGDSIKKITDACNIDWFYTWYTSKPPIISTIFDIGKGYRICRRLHKKYTFDIVHCRGYLSAILGRRLKRNHGVKFIFDMRGWWADEKQESGLWNNWIYRLVYRYFKTLEKSFFKECDFAVSLTYRGKEEIKKRGLADEGKIGVIPTCVDFEIFKARNNSTRMMVRQKLGIDKDEKVFVYSGSIGGNYEVDILIAVFKSFKTVYPKSYLLILSKENPGPDVLQRFLVKSIDRIAILNSPFTEVTNYLQAGDVGFIYYKAAFSTIGRSPTKLGEYWASGLPVVAFRAIGDLDYIINHYPQSGILLSENQNNWIEEIKNLEFKDPTMLRDYSQACFHINKGVEFYQRIYNRAFRTERIERLSMQDRLR